MRCIAGRVSILVLVVYQAAVCQDAKIIPLEEFASTKVPLIMAPAVITPIICNSGVTFVRLASPGGVQDLVSISANGQSVVHFSMDKVNDIMNPRPAGYTVQGSDVYLLISGTKAKEAVRSDRPSFYIARFKADGRYSGAVTLARIIHENRGAKGLGVLQKL